MPTSPNAPNIELTAGHNEGTMIGVKGDIISIYVLNTTQPKISSETPPYKSLAPYTFEDDLLFHGRGRDVDVVFNTLGEEQLVVVWGRAGVGKTSLLCAGVMPRLIKQSPLSVYLSTYNDPINSIRNALVKMVPRLNVKSVDGGTTPLVGELKESIQKRIGEAKDITQLAELMTSLTDYKIMIVLDQFENLFADSVDEGLRSEFVAQLSDALGKLSRDELGVLIGVDEDDIGRVLVLQSPAHKHRLQAANIELSPLSGEEAIEAIHGPASAVGFRDIFDRGLVEQMIVPELIRMTRSAFNARDAAGARPKDTDCVYPPYLQIVCTELWKQSKVYSPPHIYRETYVNAKGADGLFANHVEVALSTMSGEEEDKECAKQLLVKMAEAHPKGWVRREQIELDCPPVKSRAQVFEKLVEAELLSERIVDKQPEYSFSNPVVVETVRSRWGARTKQQYLAREELGHVYSSWLARREDGETFATKEQLQFLADSVPHLDLDPVRTLLLLRSAAQTLEPAQPWLSELKKSEGGKALIRQLEAPGEAEAADSLSEGVKAKLLLGMIDKTEFDQLQERNQPPQSGQPGDNGAHPPKPPRMPTIRFDTVSKAAVKHEKAAVRYTSALALLPLGSQDMVGHLDQELNSLKGWRRKVRRIELQGVMREADPQMSLYDVGRPWSERCLSFLWRLWRNARRQRAFWVALGGALGAGLALGLFRAAVAAIFPNSHPYSTFIDLFSDGFIFGGIVALTIAIAEPLILTLAQKKDPPKRAFSYSQRTVAVLCGGFAFGLLYANFSGGGSSELTWGESASLITPGFIGGLGISWGACGDAGKGAVPKTVWEWRRLGVAVLCFMLIQLFFFLIEDSVHDMRSLIIGKSPRTYYTDISEATVDSYPLLVQSLDNLSRRWSGYVSIVDSALTGLALTVGIRYGLIKAGRYLAGDSSSRPNRGDQ